MPEAASILMDANRSSRLEQNRCEHKIQLNILREEHSRLEQVLQQDCYAANIVPGYGTDSSFAVDDFYNLYPLI